jgi:AcrR family transcriptional regulator
MVRRTKEQALETRNKILAAATAIFDRRSWKEVNLEDVAAAAGVTRGAIYWHFGGKDELFDAVCDATPLPSELIGEEVALAVGPDPLGKFREACLSALKTAAGAPGRATLYSKPSTKEELLDPGRRPAAASPHPVRKLQAFGADGPAIGGRAGAVAGLPGY